MLTGKRLRSYLAYAVHGRKPERQPASKPRRGPVRSEAYKAWIRTLPSVVSGRSPCEAAHTGDDGGMGMKASDFSCVPLTWEEHREYHRIGREAFAARYDLAFRAVVERLNAEWRERGKA